jgi:hypothetical protein
MPIGMMVCMQHCKRGNSCQASAVDAHFGLELVLSVQELVQVLSLQHCLHSPNTLTTDH